VSAANAWGVEPSQSVRFWRNHVRVAISPDKGLFGVSCGLFGERGCDEHDTLLRWVSHDVADMETALRIVSVALDRRIEVWTLPTAQVVAMADKAADIGGQVQ